MSLTVTLDTNLFYDKAEGREGASVFDKIVELARKGKVRLYFTATTDYEDKSGGATRIIINLRREGVLQESANAGTPQDFMPGAPGLHYVNEVECDKLLHCIWPDQKWKSATDNKRRDVYHLLAHMRNGHDIYLTRDQEILHKTQVLKENCGITVMSPNKLLESAVY